MHRASLAGCCALLTLFSSALAHGQRTSSLSWVRLKGTEDCVSTQALAEGVERRVGHAVFVSASQADLSLEGHVERASRSGELVATLVVRDRGGNELGRRVLRARGDDCAALTAPLVLVIAIGIDARAALPSGAAAELSPDTKAMLEQLGLPDLGEEQIRAELAVPETTTAPAAAAPSAPEAAYASHTAIAPAGPRDSSLPQRPAFELQTALSSELGLLPHATLGLVIGAAWLAADALAVDAWLTAPWPQRSSVVGEDGSATTTLLVAGGGACLRLGAQHALELRGCAGLRVGAISSRGQGFDHDRSALAPWLEPTLYAGALFHVDRGLVFARLGSGIPAVRPELRYAGSDGRPHVLHSPAGLVARAELGVGLAL